jgi:hypothetical protein
MLLAYCKNNGQEVFAWWMPGCVVDKGRLNGLPLSGLEDRC